MALTVTDATFEKEVLQATLPCLVDFWAEWCGPCRMMSPIIDKLAETYQSKVKICKLNVDDSPNSAQTAEISSIPCMVLYRNGKEIARIIGSRPESDLLNELKTHISL